MTVPAGYFRQNRMLNPREVAYARAEAARLPKSPLVDPAVDLQWSKFARDTARPANYFDYFFGGQDIRVRIAEIPETDERFGDMPIVNFGFSVEQEKQPIYGYASYTYDAVMRGTRLITGYFTIATKYPNYMKECIATAALNRSKSNKANRIDPYGHRPLTQDDENIEKYWSRNIDEGVAASGTNVFSVHPPFSFVITYGVQNMSVDARASTSFHEWYLEKYRNQDQFLVTDENHRLVESDPTHVNRIILDAVELKQVQQTFDSDNVCVESYGFFARDIVVPMPGAGSFGNAVRI